MNLKVKFEEQNQHFRASFGEVHVVNDGGYERGLAEGKAEVLNKRTDLVVTANGEYTPSEDSTGFKSVSVEVKSTSKLPQVFDGTVTEIKAEDLEGIATVHQYTCYKHKNLKKLEIPETVTSLGQQAFYQCSALETVIMHPKQPPSIQATNFGNCARLKEIIVKTGCADAYKSATNWSAKADIIVEGDV